MLLSTYFVLFLLVHYSFYSFDMLTNKKSRNKVQTKTIKLDALRAIPAKTLEEQKKFLDIKFKKRSVKKKKFKFINIIKWFTFKNIWTFIYTTIIYILIFRFYRYWFVKYNIDFLLWQAILIIIILPLILNMILSKFGVPKGDIGIFLWGRKKNESK